MNRRTRIARTARLQSRTRLQRTARLKGGGKRREQPAVTCSMCRGPRESSSRYCAACRDVRALVLARAQGCCEVCGGHVYAGRYSLADRRRKSQGGRPVPSNLIVAHGLGGEACHGRIDFRRFPEDEARGLTVRSWQDPALVRITVRTPDGGLRKTWLHDDGRYHDEGPQADAEGGEAA